MKNILQTLTLFLSLSFFFTENLKAQNCQAVISPAGATTFCQGDSVKLQANFGQSFLWSSGQTTSFIYAKTAGNYYVTVTDLNNCTSTSPPVLITTLAAPDAALKDSIDNFTNCTYSLATSNFKLTVSNDSKTKATNTQYVINWGDGTSNTFGAAFSIANHTYTTPGSFPLSVTVKNAAGCSSTKSYTVFNGSNPSFGVASQGNTNDCAPATFTFDIINTAGNTPSTVYTFQFDDGTPKIQYTHANLPATITHQFLTSAFGKPGNGFTLTATATNPCGTTPATVGGIRISTTPIANFTVSPDSLGCVNSPVRLNDISNGGFNANVTTNMSGYIREWKISPATGWNYMPGSNTVSQQPLINFSVAGSYTITLQVTPRGTSPKCMPDAFTKTITIGAQPVIAFQTNKPATNCAPYQVNLVNKSTGANLKYNWTVSPKTGWAFTASTDSASFNPQITFTKAGNYKILLTAKNQCGQFQATDSVKVQAAPEVTLPAGKTYCENKTITFSPAQPNHTPVYSSLFSPVTQYNWSVTGTSGSTFVNRTSANSQYPEINFPAAGVYNVQVQASNGCGISTVTTQTITIIPVPQIKVQSSVLAVCKGQNTATLTASGADTYTWSPATGLNKTTGTSVTANPGVTTVYTVTGTNTASGCTASTQFTVTVKPALPLTLTTSDATICKNQQTATLTAAGADSYLWSPATGLSATTGAVVTANPLVTTNYTVTGTDLLTGCTTSKTIKITVVNLPVALAGNDTTLCAGSAINIKGTPAGGTWSGPQISASGQFTPATAGTYTVTYAYTNSNGCVATDSRIITVTSLPQIFAGNDTVLCVKAINLQLKGSPAGGSWSGCPQITAAGNFNAAAPGVYHVMYTFGNGNCSNTSTKTITVLALPTAAVVADKAICPGSMATLTATGNAATYEWYDAPVNGNLIYTGQTFTTPALQNSAIYYVAAVNNLGCATVNRTPVTVTVNPIPVAPLAQSLTLCGAGNQVTLTASATFGIYEWYDAAVNGNLLHTGATYTTTINASTNYYIQAVNAQGCVSSSRAKISVSILPAINNNIINTSQVLCAGNSATALTGTLPTGGTGTYNYVWESSTDSTSFNPVSANGNSVSYLPGNLTQTTWFRRLVVSGVCSTYSVPVKITIIPLPAAPVAQNLTVCAGNTATFTISGNPALNYQWFTSQAGGQAIFTGNQFTTPALTTTANYYVQAVTVNGCNSLTRTKFSALVVPAISNNTISGNQTICNAQTPALLTGSVPNGATNVFDYIWEFSTDNLTFLAAPGNNALANYAPGILTQTTWFRRVVSSGFCQNSISLAVKVTVLPTLANNNITTLPQTICAGSAFGILNATIPTGGDGNYTYNWQISTSGAATGFVNVTGTTGNNQNFNPGIINQTTWIRREVISGNCAAFSNTVKIDVTPGISGNVISASQSIYGGTAPATLTAPNTNGGNGNYAFSWEMSTVSATSGFTTILNATAKNLNPGIIHQTTWFRRIVTSATCSSVSNAVKITVVPVVSNNIIQQDQIICFNNAPDSLRGTQPIGGIGQYTFVWEKSTVSATTGFITAPGNANAASYFPGVLTQTTWFRRKATSGAYSINSNVIQVKVNATITNNLISTAQTSCAGSVPAALTGSLPTGGNGNFAYLWEMSTSGANAGFISAPGINNTINYSPNALQQTTWFRRKVSAGNCFEITSAAVKITINVIPGPPAINPVIICANTEASVSLPASKLNDEPIIYEWFETETGGQLLATGNAFTTPVLSSSKVYYVQASQAGCVSARTAVKVSVREETANAGEDVTILTGRSAYLKAEGGVSYKWSPAIGLSNPAVANPTATPDKTTLYKVEVTSENGCISTDEVLVTVLPKVFIPNTFTPNNDGVNDFWEITGLQKYPNCRVEIFNRWGAKIYDKNGYEQPWNGTSRTGEILPVATYYYIIHLNNQEKELSGSVTIVR